jgi:hypothetical protein
VVKPKDTTRCPRCGRLSCLGDSLCARLLPIEVTDGGSWKGISEKAWLKRLNARNPVIDR